MQDMRNVENPITKKAVLQHVRECEQAGEVYSH
jgi:hypothetical protein